MSASTPETTDLNDFNVLLVALTRTVNDLQSTVSSLGSKVDQLLRLESTDNVSYRLVREPVRPIGYQSFGVQGNISSAGRVV